METKIVYIDMDGVLCDFVLAYETALAANPDIKYPQSQYGFFRKLRPMPNAIEAIATLRANPELDVYILTAPSIYNPLCYSEKREWVEDHLGMEMVKRLIISPNKALCRGDYLIDDHTTGRGQENFTGRLIHFGSTDFPNWAAVLRLFG
ncbi:MAG: hypothetical protein AAGA31_19410 [Bacteroidota bacterium]